MTIKPYPEEEKCQNCRFSRPTNINTFTCRYDPPKEFGWTEVLGSGWCRCWELDPKVKPITKRVVYRDWNDRFQKICHNEGVISTYTDDNDIINKRIKEKFPGALFDDE